MIWEHKMFHPGSYTILPSGKVELIFPIFPVGSLEAVKIAPSDNPVNKYSFFISGLHTRPLKMTFNQFHTFGIQMKPVVIKALFGMPLCEIRDYFVEGAMVLDTSNQIEDQIHSNKSFLEKAQWVENFILRKVNETADFHTAIHLDKAIRNYVLQKQNGPTKSIQDLMGYSRTQTYRLFNEWFGVSAHSYQQLLQFIQSVHTLHNRNKKLIDVGLDTGYYDQSHFIRSFQEFTGMTPGEYRHLMTELPGQIFSTVEQEEVLLNPAEQLIV